MSVSIRPPTPGLRVVQATTDAEGVVLTLRATRVTACCPGCGGASARVHDTYTRQLRDLAWRGQPVRLGLLLRKFRCRNAACPRRVFCERLPDVAPYQRRTAAFATAVTPIGWATSADPAAATATTLGLPVSADTVLRCLRAADPPAPRAPEVVGIDDWALRRGVRYGTILVDLQTHRVVDVWPGRDAASTAAALRRYPSIRMVSRDRSEAYAGGITDALPAARQVADRFHLVNNASTRPRRELIRNASRSICRVQEPILVPTRHDMRPPDGCGDEPLPSVSARHKALGPRTAGGSESPNRMRTDRGSSCPTCLYSVPTRRRERPRRSEIEAGP